MQSDPIKVMIVDDSPSVRRMFASLIADEADMELFAQAEDPFVAVEQMRSVLPDVILLDLHMPRMDGLTFLRKIMSQRPIPVVVISSLAQEGSETMMKALEYGAVEVLEKPRPRTPDERQEMVIRISDVIRAAAQSRRTKRRPATPIKPVGERHTADIILPKLSHPPRVAGPPLIAIGASTGGTEALKAVLETLPPTLPPIAIVQHMPRAFTAAFAERLDRYSALEVFEASEGRTLGRGQAVLAQGDRHLLLGRHGTGYRVQLNNGPAVARHRPSVDVLFRSVSQVVGGSALGIILTGMGDDGAAGMAEMRAGGARTLAQDEASCAVYGMPRAAMETGAAEKAVPLSQVAEQIIRWAAAQERAGV
ncbi:protein-glutamate methylesterase/protein-glutamine glutaminase [Thioclava kandeliae]|uniref:Protein-glutamate methylesterase/protein-glutamine glutaminase n=1 Tax=Thioclava kandeliae TaxID=3070818 RepID=A0ABV1SEU2_9RHOB